MNEKNNTQLLIKTPQNLSKHLNLTSNQKQLLSQVHEDFPIRLPKDLLKKISQSPNKSLLLKQFIPDPQELIKTPGYSQDPLQEKKAQKLPGLLQKYHGRVLITLTQACAVHCRYCFRRHFSYKDNNPGKTGFKKIISVLQQDPSIHEVILSGGDPLMVNNTYLTWCFKQFKTIPHLKTIRIHTRIPTVLPQRIDSDLIKTLNNTTFRLIMVLHINHADEITPAAASAIAALKQTKLTLLNQSVLLKDINDKADTLIKLSHILWEHQILPYYLHTLDKVQGTAHFAVPIPRAKALIQKLRASLPGYLVPRLSCEQAQKPAKILLA